MVRLSTEHTEGGSMTAVELMCCPEAGYNNL